MKRVTKGVLFLAIWMAAGCHRHKDIIKYAEDPENGLKKEMTLGNIHYKVQYKPVDYILAAEHLDSVQRKEREAALKGTVWFNISFNVKDFNQSPLRYQVSGLEEYTERQDYYLNQAPHDIYLLYGADTLYVSSYWFENSQNLTPYETMIVGFTLPAGDTMPQQDLKLSFYDRVFKNGIIKAVVKKEDI